MFPLQENSEVWFAAFLRLDQAGVERIRFEWNQIQTYVMHWHEQLSTINQNMLLKRTTL